MAHIAEAFARPSMEGLASPNGSYFTMPIGLCGAEPIYAINAINAIIPLHYHYGHQMQKETRWGFPEVFLELVSCCVPARTWVMWLRSATMHQTIQARLHIRMNKSAVCTLPAAMQVLIHQIRASLTIYTCFFCVYHLNRCKAFTCGRWMNHVWNFQFSLPLSIFFSDFPWLIILQRGNPVSIAGCPTKRSMPRLIWSLINSTHLHFPTFAVIATG